MATTLKQGSEDENPEALFSRAYLRSKVAQRDDKRFRTRLYAEFRSVLSDTDQGIFYDLVRRELGVTIPSGSYGARFSTFFEDGELRDVLDAITLVWKIHTASGEQRKADNWLRFVRRVFHEESLGYTVNDSGAVRYLVDEEFERTRFSAIDGLGAAKLKAVRAAVEAAFKKLDREPFETKAAVRSMFEAIETLCKVQGEHNDDLDERMVKARIRPIVTRVYGVQDTSAQSFAAQTLESFIKWVNAGHKYRHGPKAEEPHDPPLELAVAFLSQGAAHIRFLIDLDAKKGKV